MALTTRRTHDRDVDTVEETRRGPVPGLIRGLFTLAGVLAAGFLVWLASQVGLDQTGDFWVAMGLIAAAGIVIGLSQLFGGWTKWGWPRFSPGVFLLGFLPTLLLVGGILLATRNTGQGTRDEVSGWISDIGLGGLASDLSLFQGVLAFTLGLVFAFTFDTTGPRTRVVAPAREIPDEDVHDYRRTESTTTTTPVARSDDRSVAEELRGRDEHVETAPVGAREERVEIRDPDTRRETT